MERTIKVTGKGTLAVKPDRIRLLMNLEGGDKSYEQIVKMSTEQVEQLRDCFEKLGFDRTDLKTTSFHINTCYENYQDIMKAWKKRFVGYEFRHGLKLEFDVDNERLGKILYALGQAPVSPEFHIVYTIKDVEAAKNQLLEKAVNDSMEKAQVLTQAAGVALGDIVTMDYSWDEVEFAVRPMAKLANARAMSAVAETESYNIDIEPENIQVEDTVTIVWAIR